MVDPINKINQLKKHRNEWDKRWIDLCKLVASWSKDRSTKVGAVIIDKRNIILSLGWNGFPKGIKDNIDERHERPVKYKWIEHAERNAIYNAVSNGINLADSRIYIQWYPCSDCARAIIQSGISEIICYKPDFNDERWGLDFKMVEEMFNETDIFVRYIEE